MVINDSGTVVALEVQGRSAVGGARADFSLAVGTGGQVSQRENTLHISTGSVGAPCANSPRNR